MDKKQKQILWVLVALGALYFALFAFPNADMLGSDNPIVYLDRDEYVTYPIVERMLAFEGDIHNIWGRLIVYGDYHYGYPFYFLSFLILLPLRLIQGSAFFDNIPTNILLLRQFINVVPMVLTAGILSYTHSHFRSWWKSLLIFVLILSVPAVVRSNLHWWHPDSLMLLCIALTFFFLDLDDFRLGRNFYLAAAACGLAAAIKLMGFFFFLAIPLYLLLARKKAHFDLKKIATAAVLFVLVMAAVIVLSNPFLFYRAPRQEMLAIQTFKSSELSGGYEHDSSPDYAKGPRYWRRTLLVSYGQPWMMLAFAGLLLAGCFFGRQRRLNALIAAWSLPLAIYLLWFVAPKPDHYLLPLLVPLLSVAFDLIQPLQDLWTKGKTWQRSLAIVGGLALAVLLISQFSFQIGRCLEQLSVYYRA
ncbi:MAG: hypothetical protein PWQ55_1981 [Chloroflexota bacterium]|nr:hypothetical protein [Chloroflexota bacterium]